MHNSITSILDAASYPFLLSMSVSTGRVEDLVCTDEDDVRKNVRKHGFRSSIDSADIKPMPQ
jgi:hypothetical protein